MMIPKERYLSSSISAVVHMREQARRRLREVASEVCVKRGERTDAPR